MAFKTFYYDFNVLFVWGITYNRKIFLLSNFKYLFIESKNNKYPQKN